MGYKRLQIDAHKYINKVPMRYRWNTNEYKSNTNKDKDKIQLNKNKLLKLRLMPPTYQYLNLSTRKAKNKLPNIFISLFYNHSTLYPKIISLS